jgi:acyl-CoA synthetase (AMP-forming)/AMP-acid ligase II
MDDGHTQLTFAQLHAAVVQHADTLIQQQAPATVFVDDQLSIIQQMVAFMGIIHSGRCAAVSDPDWPSTVRDSVQRELGTALTEPSHTHTATPTSPFYIGFTSGSTGMPKGFRRHHQSWTESLRVCLDTFGPDAASCVMAPGRFSHSLFLFGMVMGLWSGAGVVVQDKFSVQRMINTLQQGQAPCLVAVPSQLVLMIDVAKRRCIPQLTEVKLILISGARWMRERTTELQALCPNARIVEFYGASETSFMAWMDANSKAPSNAVGKAFANVEIDIRQAQPPQGVGQIFVRSPMLFTDYVGNLEDSTAAVRDGDWLSVRDMGYIDTQGWLCLVGRENRMIVTQGKNLFAEELETVLMTHPSIASASVHGVQDPARGQQVVAILHFQATQESDLPNATALNVWCRERLESFKIPKRFKVCHPWPLTPSGKTDHHALAQALNASHNKTDCHPLCMSQHL